jgi:hypothetical protein
MPVDIWVFWYVPVPSVIMFTFVLSFGAFAFSRWAEVSMVKNHVRIHKPSIHPMVLQPKSGLGLLC